MDIDGLHKLIEQCNTFNAEKFNGITELINAQNSRVRAKIEETHDSLKREINGHTKDLIDIKDIEIPAIKEKLDKSTRLVKWISKHPGKCLLLFFLSIVASNYILEQYSIPELIKFIKSIL